LEKTEVLPDIFGEGALDADIRFYSEIVESHVDSSDETTNLAPYDQVIALSDTRYAIEKIARIVSFAKSAYFQRTDNIDLPYVIAGIPFSPERSWGNELWLLAADKLVRNYIQYINMRERTWDTFVSWSEFIQEQKKLPGGLLTPLHETFHLNLSMDVKYNLQGLLILTHELAHAACQINIDTIDNVEIYSVLRYALFYIFPLKQKLLEIFRKCQSETQENWRDCPLRKLVRALDTSIEKEFTKYMGTSEVARLIYEGLIDLVAFRLAGISYIKALKDYTLEPAIRHQHPGTIQLMWNKSFFFGILLRLSIITSYFSTEQEKQLFPEELLERATACFKRVQDENLSILRELLRNKKISQACYNSNRQCIKCVSEIGLHIGVQVSEFDKEIFEDIFFSKKDTAFCLDKDLVKAISNGKIVLQEEPRKILDACCESAGRGGKIYCPAGLYSLAFNKHKGKK